MFSEERTCISCPWTRLWELATELKRFARTNQIYPIAVYLIDPRNGFGPVQAIRNSNQIRRYLDVQRESEIAYRLDHVNMRGLDP